MCRLSLYMRNPQGYVLSLRSPILEVRSGRIFLSVFSCVHQTSDRTTEDGSEVPHQKIVELVAQSSQDAEDFVGTLLRMWDCADYRVSQ